MLRIPYPAYLWATKTTWMFKYNQSSLQKIEALIKEAGYIVRYEKGNFKSGYCLLQEKKVIVINKYYDVESRINSFIEIIPLLDIDISSIDEKDLKFFQSLQQAKLVA
jgi:hypothetical protein